MPEVRRGMVVAAHRDAARVGAEVLGAGGNAVDAAIATNAVMAVVYPQACGLGGDLFCQVWIPGEPAPRGYNGSGRAPGALSAELLRGQGHAEMPAFGPHPVTVPGAVEAWESLWRACGSLPLHELLAPAGRIARAGFAVTPNIAQGLGSFESMLQEDPGGSALLVDGRAPRVGEVMTRAGVAEVLERVGREGAAGFYRGEVAEALVGALRRRGGVMSIDDLAGHRGDWVEPVAGHYRDLTVYELPPNTQGLVALALLARLDRVPTGEIAAWSPVAIRAFIAACVSAYSLRDRHIGDPELPAPTELFLEPGDTTYLCAADSSGMLVSLIQSNYMGVGSGVVIEGLGINLQNRGASFSLEKGHPNQLRGGRRTRHTLIPAMAARGGAPSLVFGSMGGDGQPQIHVNLLAGLVDRGQDPQSAVDAPRVICGLPGSRSLAYEPGFPSEGLAAAAELGFEPVAAERGGQFGHAQVIRLEQGDYAGGADSRADSGVARPAG
ncbi:MAG: gamma-glutamyltransferase family protein [Candidatus Dormibacteria bacterium]